jgi:hypothetical protein
MIGDNYDMLGRLKLVLPARWFSDNSPILDAVLSGAASAWSGLYTLLSAVKSQCRIATATGIFLDIIAADFFGNMLIRRSGETDLAYSTRIRASLLAPRATRAGLIDTLTKLTGRKPDVFEPLNATDTGGYNVNIGYNTTGGYGSMNLPYQFFLKAYRANNSSVGNASGYNEGPGGYDTAPLYYADMTGFSGSVSDDEIYAAIAAVMPTASIAWTQISN